MHAYLYESSHFPQDIDFSELLKDQFNSTQIYNTQTIEEVRQFKKVLIFPPQSKTLYVLTNLDEAKAEAQNAILKLLEEPPNEHVLFVVLVKNENNIIPTIFSRVQKIQNVVLKSEHKQVLGSDPQNWFLPLSKITDRNVAIETMQSVLEGEYTVNQKEAAITTIENLKKNGNVTLQLTNFILQSLPHS